VLTVPDAPRHPSGSTQADRRDAAGCGFAGGEGIADNVQDAEVGDDAVYAGLSGERIYRDRASPLRLASP
jgi:hypothetical protein